MNCLDRHFEIDLLLYAWCSSSNRVLLIHVNNRSSGSFYYTPVENSYFLRNLSTQSSLLHLVNQNYRYLKKNEKNFIERASELKNYCDLETVGRNTSNRRERHKMELIFINFCLEIIKKKSVHIFLSY